MYKTVYVSSLAELKQMRGDGSSSLLVYIVNYAENGQITPLVIYQWVADCFDINDDWNVVTPHVGDISLGRWIRMKVLANGATGPQGPQGATGADGAQGIQGIQGIQGPAGPSTVGSPVNRSLVLATAYQATNPSKPALVSVTLQANSSISLTGAVNNEGSIVIGSTSAVASGTGTAIGIYKNNLGGTLIVGLNLSNQAANTYTFGLPAGWYFAARQTSGTGLQIVSAYDQSLG